MNPIILVPLIQGSVSIVLSLITWIEQITVALKQNTEMTQAQSDALDAAIAQLPQEPWWIAGQ
jgi:hypothetical protein